MNRTLGVLLVEGGPDDTQMFPLLGGTNTLGRESSNDVVDTENGVSRRHVEIVETQTGYILRDLSTNGTYVNDRLISKDDHVLGDGDRIRLGSSAVTFVFRSDSAGRQPRRAGYNPAPTVSEGGRLGAYGLFRSGTA